MIKTNTSSINVTISDLIGNTRNLFGVRGYTVNGYVLWTYDFDSLIEGLDISTTNQRVKSRVNFALIITML